MQSFTTIRAPESDNDFMLDKKINSWVPIPVRPQVILQKDSSYLEEARNEQAYDEFKEDVHESIEHDSDLEAEFFGRRELSTSYFSEDLAHDAQYRLRTPSPAENYAPLEEFEVIKPYYSNKRFSGPFWNVAGQRFTRAPILEEINRLNAESNAINQNSPSPSSTQHHLSPTSVPALLPAPSISPIREQNFVREATREQSPSCCDFHRALEQGVHAKMSPETFATVDDEYCSNREQTQKLCELVQSALECENSSLRGMGAADSSVIVHESSADEGYAASATIRFSIVSTSAFSETTTSNDTNDPDKQHEDTRVVSSKFSSISPRYSATSPRYVPSSSSPHYSISPTHTSTSPEYGPKSSVQLGGVLNVSEAKEGEDFVNANFFGEESTTVEDSSPQIKSKIIDLIQDNDSPNIDYAQSKNEKKRTLQEPRFLRAPHLGRPEDSTLFKRRTKKATSSTTEVPELQLSSFSSNSSSDSVPIPSVRFSKKPTYADLPVTKKRRARESVDIYDDYNRRVSKKRARLSREDGNTSESAILPPTPRTTASSNFDGSPMATALKGFPGQFDMKIPPVFMIPNYAPAKHYVFGDHLHANGKIINPSFIADPFTSLKHPDLRGTIIHADFEHNLAESTLRLAEEEALRKEAHRECAAARLEGVSVGYYRYFVGHMTVEEYIEARMCVCWEGCYCSKLCTQYGDMACPCVGDLIVGDEA